VLGATRRAVARSRAGRRAGRSRSDKPRPMWRAALSSAIAALPPWARSGLRLGQAVSGPVLFIGGIGWDALTLGRIDAWLDNLILAAYLAGLGLALVWEHRAAHGRLPTLLTRWRWLARLAVHFLLGGLLSAYAIYYIQSASTWISTSWLLLIAVLLLVNEFLRDWIGTTGLRLALYLLCAFSFLLFWIPVATGWLERGVSLLAGVGAIALTATVLALMEWSPRASFEVATRTWGGLIEIGERVGQPLPSRVDRAVRAVRDDLIRRVQGRDPALVVGGLADPTDPTDPEVRRLRRDPVARAMWQLRPAVRYSSYALSWGGLLLLLLVFDVVGAIPPVPLSTLHLGIYRDVRIRDGVATLAYEAPPWWRPFARDDGRFRLRAQDRVCAFAPVYAPRRTAPRLYHRWEYWDSEERKWVWTKDTGTWVQAAGGKENGSMHFTCKRRSLRPGLWRVSVELPDGRVVGRRRFSMLQGPETAPELLERTWP